MSSLETSLVVTTNTPPVPAAVTALVAAGESMEAAVEQMNLDVVAAFLTANDCDLISCTYSGSGDEWDGMDFQFKRDGEWLAPGARSMKGRDDTFVLSSVDKNNDINSIELKGFQRFISDLVDQIIAEQNLDGFWDGGGGDGSILIDNQGRCDFTHSYNSSNSDVTEYHLLDLLSQPANALVSHTKQNINTLIAAMRKETNIGWVQMSYSGSGDSGSGSDISFYGKTNQALNDSDVNLLLSKNQVSDNKSTAVSVLAPAIMIEMQTGDKLPFAETVYQWNNETRSRDTYEMVVDKTIDDFCADLIDQIVTATGNDGYENNEGGSGEITISVSGSAILNHENYFTDSTSTEYLVGTRGKIPVEIEQSTELLPQG